MIANYTMENLLNNDKQPRIEMKQSQPLTAPTRKAGFRVPKTVLWLIKHQFFKSSFELKIPPFGQLQNVMCNPIGNSIQSLRTLRKDHIALYPKEKNVVFPMCKFGCDEIFERGYVSVKNGKLISLNKKPISSAIQVYINNIIGNDCT